MPNWKLTLTYDGAAYHGWQVQPGLPTIQGELRSALHRVLGPALIADSLPQGSGRTDAGVHALALVASVELAPPIPPANLERALNRTLPPAIRILRAERAQDSFHARHSAEAKTYEYRIFRGQVCSPFQARYIYACQWPLNLALLQRAAGEVVGEHDFMSLAASDPDCSTRGEDGSPADVEGKSTIRTIFTSAWEEPSEEMLVYRVRGNGFLHHMVRNLVGTMIEIARGQFPADAMPRILEARARSAAGPTAPARGLFLHSVEYPAGHLLE
jgi:tRNA pseudouridine38-40 synthase